MRNKTCGECQWYDHHHLLCVIGGDVEPTERAKDCFVSANPTNGDCIRQGGNKRLITFSAEWSCFHCAYHNGIERRCERPEGKDCFGRNRSLAQRSGRLCCRKRRKCKTSGFMLQKRQRKRGAVMAQSETSKRLKKMLRMAENLAGLSAKLGELMEHEGIPAIEVEGCLVTHEKDPMGNDRAILRMIDERLWALLQRAQDKVIIKGLLAKEGGKDE